jgi:hypothetical protein
MKEDKKQKRGPYKKTLDKKVKSRPSNYFRPDHEHKGHFVAWTNAYDRADGQISVCYKLQGDRKQYRTPRWKTAWFDDKGLEQCKLAVEQWKKSNNNSMGVGNLIPSFYLKHRRDYIKWLNNTAKHTTIYQYEQTLRQYVFPYFVDRLDLKRPKQWNQDVIDKWDAFLSEHIKQATSRNRKRTAFRRYLKFLKRNGEIKIVPQIFDEATRRDTKETVIPGELPEWKDVIAWLKKLPAGRYRFIRAVSMGFGIRISEAFAIEYDDFFGEESEKIINSRNDFISRLVEKELGALFLYVNKADKKKVSKEITRILGEQDNDPKTGPYTACCTSVELAEFIHKMMENGEHLEELSRDEVYKIIYALPVDDSPYLFNQYRPHDDRRLNITLQCLDLSMDISDVVEICTLLHGQSSREVFGRYFQWGLTQRRKQQSKRGKKLSIFKKKKASN